ATTGTHTRRDQVANQSANRFTRDSSGPALAHCSGPRALFLGWDHAVAHVPAGAAGVVVLDLVGGDRVVIGGYEPDQCPVDGFCVCLAESVGLGQGLLGGVRYVGPLDDGRGHLGDLDEGVVIPALAPDAGDEPAAIAAGPVGVEH